MAADADGGERLRELVRGSRRLPHRQLLLPEYAELQLALAPHVDDLVAAGVPDGRLAVLPAQLDAVLDDPEACMVGREHGLTLDEHDRLRALVPEYADRCVRLAALGIPETRRQLVHRLELPPGGPDILGLRDAYLEPFASYGSRAELAETAELAHFTGTAARALSWHRFVQARDPEFRYDDEEAVRYGLRRLLSLGPLGTWG